MEASSNYENIFKILNNFSKKVYEKIRIFQNLSIAFAEKSAILIRRQVLI